jgi:transcriptional regulator with XRE-family HTH domain
VTFSKNEIGTIVGGALRELRVSRKMSIETLGNLTGLGYSQISRLERGRLNCSLYNVYIIVHKLDVSVPVLFRVLAKGFRESQTAKSGKRSSDGDASNR